MSSFFSCGSEKLICVFHGRNCNVFCKIKLLGNWFLIKGRWSACMCPSPFRGKQRKTIRTITCEFSIIKWRLVWFFMTAEPGEILVLWITNTKIQYSTHQVFTNNYIVMAVLYISILIVYKLLFLLKTIQTNLYTKVANSQASLIINSKCLSRYLYKKDTPLFCYNNSAGMEKNVSVCQRSRIIVTHLNILPHVLQYRH